MTQQTMIQKWHKVVFGSSICIEINGGEGETKGKDKKIIKVFERKKKI